MSTWKRGKNWYWQFRIQGQVIRCEHPYLTQGEARDAQAVKRAELLKNARMTRMEFVGLLEKRLSEIQKKRDKFYYRDNKSMIDQLIKLNWHMKTRITVQDVTTFLDFVAEKVSPQRANKYRAYLSALFSCDKRFHNPVREISRYPETTAQKYVPSEEDVMKVLAKCTPEQRDYLWVLTLTAGRCGEINKLKITDCDLNLGFLTLATRKTKDGSIQTRRIRMGDSLRDIVARRVARAREEKMEYIFFNRRTKTHFNYRSKFLRSKCEDAEVRPFTYHCLRHHTAILMDRAGVPLTDIQKTLGHQRATTTDIYLSSIREVQTIATDSIEEKLGGRYQKSLQQPDPSEKTL